LRPKIRTSFHHQPEAQHPKIVSYPQAARPITPSFTAPIIRSRSSYFLSFLSVLLAMQQSVIGSLSPSLSGRPEMFPAKTRGWWACVRCGTVVPDKHTGPCFICGDLIVRVTPTALSRSENSWHLTALITVAAAWIASSLLGASAAGWNAELAVNVWSLSVAYYALARMEGGIG
jgi:hypothetical protein